MILRAMIFGGFAALGLVGPASAAGSLEGSASELASQIVQKSATTGMVTIGISSFPHADNNCSELSNYLADLLVASMFDVGQGRVQIVERAQLTTIFEELKFNRSGAVDTSTAKELGKIYGVDTLVIGSITEIGDEISIVARQISTETGTVVSAALSRFPKTATIRTLMENRSASLCGYGNPTQRGASTQSAARSSGSQSGASVGSRSDVFEAEGFEARLIRLVYSKSQNTGTILIRFTNTSKKRIHLAVERNSLAVTDDLGGVLRPKSTWSGLKICQSNASSCVAKYPANVTAIATGKSAQLTFNFSGSSNGEPKLLNVSFEIIYTPNPDAPSSFRLVSFGLYDLKPEVR